MLDKKLSHTNFPHCNTLISNAPVCPMRGFVLDQPTGHICCCCAAADVSALTLEKNGRDTQMDRQTPDCCFTFTSMNMISIKMHIYN